MKNKSKLSRFLIASSIAISAVFSASYASAGVVNDFLKCMIECETSCSITGVCSDDKGEVMR